MYATPKPLSNAYTYSCDVAIINADMLLIHSTHLLGGLAKQLFSR